jgi:hypothetical protein
MSLEYPADLKHTRNGSPFKTTSFTQFSVLSTMTFLMLALDLSTYKPTKNAVNHEARFSRQLLS